MTVLREASSNVAQLTDVVRSLEQWGAERDWLGPDPYEGLNARRFGLAKSTRLSRRVLVQAVKRSPVDIRPLLGIDYRHNAAGVAQIVSGYAKGTFLPEDEQRAKLDRWVDHLADMALRLEPTACWGYHFDLETRVFFYPGTMPNTIATSFAGQALLDAHEANGDSRLLDLAVRSGEFFLEHVPQTEAEGGAYFGYFVGDRSPIHNANMLVAGLLARLAAATGRTDFREASAAAVGYCLAKQRPDGSWPYGERPNLQWVDGFHTGYILDALMECQDASIHPDIAAGLQRGLEHYNDRLFLPDGAAKYYDDSLYPIDGQCVAQGIRTFALASRIDAKYESTAWRALDFALRRMRRSDGAFMFQRRRFWANPAPHVRWVQAPMFRALAELAALAEE